MNFLAHLYLSPNKTTIIIGNFIADHVKGKAFSDYHPEIQKGILFHREIDKYTDNHKIVKRSKHRLHERYRHYDGVIIDIFYDYFLAKNWDNYSAIPLDIYANSIYNLLTKNKEVLPEKSIQFLKYMIEYDILFNYKTIEGIQQVLNGMNRRTQGKSQMNLASEDLKILHDELEEDFEIFFKDLQNFTVQKIEELS